MSILRRTEIPIAITALVALIVLLDLFTGIASINAVSTLLQKWSIILAGFALGIGAINLFMRHLKQIKERKSPRWTSSIIVVFFLVVTIITGVLDLNLNNPIFRFILDSIYARLYAGVWAFQGFFMIYAFYRAFKVRGLESGIMFAAALIMILKNAPIFEQYLGLNFQAFAQWIMDVPNVAGARAMTVSAAMGSLILIMRALIGKERAYLKRSGGEK